MPPGFLAVLSEPGEKVTIEEFQDWYNNEHVPLRLDHLPSFLTGARYSASDSCLPSWIALYDIDDTSTFNHESYTRLRANRSLREGELVKRLELLDRRTCELLTDENKGLTSSYDPKDPTKFLLTQGVECRGDEEVKNWLRETAVQLNEVEGWTRTRGYRCIDNLKSGISVGSNPKEQEIPRYLVVHEFLHPAAADSEAFKTSLLSKSSTFGIQFVGKEERRWGLYRAYPSVAQEIPV